MNVCSETLEHELVGTMKIPGGDTYSQIYMVLCIQKTH